MFPSIYDRLDIETDRSLEEADILKWMTKGKTTLVLKDPQINNSKQL